jgi:hypothetical protein
MPILMSMTQQIKMSFLAVNFLLPGRVAMLTSSLAKITVFMIPVATLSMASVALP